MLQVHSIDGPMPTEIICYIVWWFSFFVIF